LVLLNAAGHSTCLHIENSSLSVRYCTPNERILLNHTIFLAIVKPKKAALWLLSENIYYPKLNHSQIKASATAFNYFLFVYFTAPRTGMLLKFI